jgi:mannose-1-phosphate guanylyltransferase/mannose-1-phosphate guanylyltransferase/phosphomannomutase
MQAVIVAGGKGTRLRPLTYATPKPMIPLFDRPFLQVLVERCRDVGITDILLNVRYGAEQIQRYFQDGSQFGVKVRYSLETEALDTCGAVKLAEEYFTGETLLVFNADILTNLDLKALIAAHRSAQAKTTIALYRVQDPTAFGLVELEQAPNAAQPVRAFREKPTPEEAARLGIDTINAGTYVMEPEVFQEVPAGQPWSMERQLFPSLVSKGTVFGFPYEGYWMDIGNPQKYLQAHLDILSGAMPYALEAQEIAPQVWVGEGVEIAPEAKLQGPCYIGPYSQLGPKAMIPAHTLVGRGALIHSALTPGVYPAGTWVY